MYPGRRGDRSFPERLTFPPHVAAPPWLIHPSPMPEILPAVIDPTPFSNSPRPLPLKFCRPTCQFVLAHSFCSGVLTDLKGLDNEITGLPRINDIMQVVQASSRVRGRIFHHFFNQPFQLLSTVASILHFAPEYYVGRHLRIDKAYLRRRPRHQKIGIRTRAAHVPESLPVGLTHDDRDLGDCH